MREQRSLGQARSDGTYPGDEVLVERALRRDETAIRALIQCYNQRLFRMARAVVRNDAEAEDVVQASYVKAFTHLQSFRGNSRFATWLTRIALNEAFSRVRSRRQTTSLEQLDLERTSAQILQFPSAGNHTNPEFEMSRQEIRELLEQAVDQLPANFRVVFVLRDVEGLSIEETAAQLDLKRETVRTRLHRARKLVRAAIEEQVSGNFATLFPFDGERCVHMADRVLALLAGRVPQPNVTEPDA